MSHLLDHSYFLPLEDSELSVSQGSHATEVIQFIRKSILSFGSSKLSGRFYQNSVFDLSNPNFHLCFVTISCNLSRKSNFLSAGHSFWTIVTTCNNIVFPKHHNSQKTLSKGKPLLNKTLVRSPVSGAVWRLCSCCPAPQAWMLAHT